MRDPKRDTLGQARRRHGVSLVGAEDVLRVPFPDFFPGQDPVHDAAERVEIGRRANVRASFRSAPARPSPPCRRPSERELGRRRSVQA